jgi:hypothetical protein
VDEYHDMVSFSAQRPRQLYGSGRGCREVAHGVVDEQTAPLRETQSDDCNAAAIRRADDDMVSYGRLGTPGGPSGRFPQICRYQRELHMGCSIEHDIVTEVELVIARDSYIDTQGGSGLPSQHTISGWCQRAAAGKVPSIDPRTNRRAFPQPINRARNGMAPGQRSPTHRLWEECPKEIIGDQETYVGHTHSLSRRHSTVLGVRSMCPNTLQIPSTLDRSPSFGMAAGSGRKRQQLT